MRLELCEQCGRYYEISRRGKRTERDSIDHDGRVWRVVISDVWLAHQCEISVAPPPQHGS